MSINERLEALEKEVVSLKEQVSKLLEPVTIILNLRHSGKIASMLNELDKEDIEIISQIVSKNFRQSSERMTLSNDLNSSLDKGLSDSTSKATSNDCIIDSLKANDAATETAFNIDSSDDTPESKKSQ
jgi:endo-alpha-1,4-polygalactosaminidase (GH114 family)